MNVLKDFGIIIFGGIVSFLFGLGTVKIIEKVLYFLL